MPLELSQMYGLLQNPKGSVVAGRMPVAVARHFGCSLGIVYLSSRSLNHIIIEKRHCEIIDLLVLPEMLDRGIWIADRENAACVAFHPPDTFSTLFCAVKIVGGGFEPYLSSFYPGKSRQIEAKRQRGMVLQEHR